MPRIRSNVVVFSDTHVGSAVGLWPDSVITEQGNTITANKQQAWLMRCWKHFRQEIKKLRPKPIGVFVGDGIQGTADRQGQLCTNVLSTQAYALRTIMEPIWDCFKEGYWVKGTTWHVGKCAEHVELVADYLGAKPQMCDGKEVGRTWWMLNLDIGGIVGNFMHAIGSSRVPHYQATVPLRETLTIIDEVRRYTEDAPDIRVVTRAHRHRCVVVGVPPGIWGVTTPCWQLPGEYGFSRGFSLRPHIGWVLFQWDGQDVVIKPRTYTGPRLHVEVVK